MEELEISDKRYISTRRAAREHGYHSDYMGQLIRGKKVVGQKIGRAWYIEEESLSRYLGKEPARPERPEQEAQSEQRVPPAQENPAQEEKQAEEKIPEEQKVEEDVPEPEPVREEAAEVKEEESARIRIRKPEVEPARETGGLRYVPDDIPALPVVTRMPQPREYRAHAAHAAYAQPEPPRTASTFPYISLSVVAIIAIAGAVFASNFVSATIVSEEGKAAAARYVIHW